MRNRAMDALVALINDIKIARQAEASPDQPPAPGTSSARPSSI